MFRRSAPLPAIARQELRSFRADRALAWTLGERVAEILSDSDVAKVTGEAVSSLSDEEPVRSYSVVNPCVVIALTAQRLLAIDQAEQAATESYWWHEVDRAIWRPEDRVFSVSFTTGAVALSVRVGPNTPMEFLSFLRDRVESSVVLSETVPLTSAENVRVAVRRDNAGELFVQALCDPGIDPAHPAVARLIAPVVQRLREVSGAR